MRRFGGIADDAESTGEGAKEWLVEAPPPQKEFLLWGGEECFAEIDEHCCMWREKDDARSAFSYREMSFPLTVS